MPVRFRTGAAPQAALLILAACAGRPDADHAALDQPPIDAQLGVTADIAAGWARAAGVEVDLNGDGSTERVVIASDVTVMATGEPLWEDGHRWAAYVEEAGRRTLLYAGFLPHGVAEIAVGAPDQLGRRSIVVVTRTPQHSRTVVVAYDSAGAVRTVSDANHPLEQWLPSLAATRAPPATAGPPPQAAAPAPWSRDTLAVARVPAEYLTAWRRAENRGTCALVAPADTRVANARPRIAVFSGGWGVAYDAPGQRSLFGVAGTGVAPDDLYEGWTGRRAWADGSRAAWGLEGGTGPNQLAYLRIAGQRCLYNVWSRVGEQHLVFLLEQLRFVHAE